MPRSEKQSEAARQHMINMHAQKRAAKAAQEQQIAEGTVGEPEVRETRPVDRKPRRERATFNGMQQRLAVEGLDPNYHYHWFNDVGSKIAFAKQVGYEFVTQDEVSLAPGRFVVSENNSLGSSVTTHVNDNPVIGSNAVLMKRPREEYEEDQKEEQDKITAEERVLTTTYGVANSYTPHADGKAMRRTIEVMRNGSTRR